MSGQIPLRILYLTYNENVLESGILYSQVRQMLAEMSEYDSSITVKLFSFISPKLWLKRRKGYSHLRNKLKEKRINFKYALMPAAQTWEWPAIPLFIACCLPRLLIEAFFGRCQIIHARSYGAGLLALITSRMLGCRFVFDPRGPFPEEMVLNGRWKKNSLTFRIWKRLEWQIITKADAVIGVTPEFKRLFSKQGARKSVFVPSRIDIEAFSAGSDVRKIRKSLIFVSDTSWYSIEKIGGYFLEIRKRIPGLKLELVTRFDRNAIRERLAGIGIAETDWTLKSGSREEIPSLISGAGLGLVLAVKPSGNWDAWPIKMVEYLAAGIPIAVEKDIGDIVVSLVEKWRLGVIIDPEKQLDLNEIEDVFENGSKYSDNCLKFARLKLPVLHSAKQYLRLYRQLVTNS